MTFQVHGTACRVPRLFCAYVLSSSFCLAGEFSRVRPIVFLIFGRPYVHKISSQNSLFSALPTSLNDRLYATTPTNNKHHDKNAMANIRIWAKPRSVECFGGTVAAVGTCAMCCQ